MYLHREGPAKSRRLWSMILVAAGVAAGVAACSPSGRMPRGVPVSAKPPAPTTEEVLARLEPVEKSELKDYRGGFVVNGFTISFGATVSAAVTEATGRLSALSTSLQVPSGGQAVIETTETTNSGGAVQSLVTSQTLTAGQANQLLNSMQMELRGSGTLISQQGLTSVIENTISNAAIQAKIEMTIDVHNFTQRVQTLRTALDSQMLARSLQGISLGR